MRIKVAKVDMYTNTKKQVDIIFSHDGTSGVDVVVAEEGNVVFLRCVCGWKRLCGIADVARGCAFVVHARCERVVDHMLRYVRPKLCLLSCALHSLQHLVWVHVSVYRYPALFPVYLYRFHPCTGSVPTSK